MRKLIAICLIMVMGISAFAMVEGDQVMYQGGTAKGLTAGTIGKIDSSSQDLMTFEASGQKLAIPYSKMQSFEYSRVVARHYGVLATVAIVMLKYRQRRHYLKVTYLDEKDVSQVAVFEISKEAPRTLVSVLQTRAPQACNSKSFGDPEFGSCAAHAR